MGILELAAIIKIFCCIIAIIIFIFWLESLDSTIKMHKRLKNMEKMQQSTVNLLDKIVDQLEDIQNTIKNK